MSSPWLALPIFLIGGYLAFAEPPRAAEVGPAPRPVWVDEDLHPGAARWRASDRAAIGCRTMEGFAAWDWSVTTPGAAYGTEMLRQRGECVVSINPTSWRQGSPTGVRGLVRLCREGSDAPTGCYLFRSESVAPLKRG